MSPYFTGLWAWPAVLMPLGFLCQFVGHAIEGNRPEVFSDWRFFFVGLELVDPPHPRPGLSVSVLGGNASA